MNQQGRKKRPMKILVEVCLHFERGVVLKNKNYSILEKIYIYTFEQRTDKVGIVVFGSTQAFNLEF